MVDAKFLVRFWAQLVISPRYEFQCRQCSFYFLIYNHRIDCPLLSWHSLTQRGKKEKGGNERPFDEKTEPSPPLAHFPPFFSSLPCGVNLAKRRQHQPIYTSCMQHFFLCYSFACLSSVSTLIQLSGLCVYDSYVCVTVLFSKHLVVYYYLVQ